VEKGVLLFNLGGPENLNEVRPFLYNLFSDPEIIRIRSDFLRKSLAWIIASARQKKSRNLYRQIGGGSPLRRITEAQALALEEDLKLKGSSARVYVGMRCWKPSIDEAVDRILGDRIERLVLLPLFPQYSVTTTGSCLKHFSDLDRRLKLSDSMKITTIQAWYDEPLYVDLMTNLIREGLARFSQDNKDNKDTHLLYSAHSIPARYVEQGDPYLEQTKKFVELINSRLENAYSSELAFQSKLGPVKWLGPSTREVLAKMGERGVGKVLVIPISFVSDHIETLQEIDIVYKRIAARSGIKEFYRSESPNLRPEFINALAGIALGQGRL
jgi:protoporphyrin/coproporphyrin ferrochelatase